MNEIKYHIEKLKKSLSTTTYSVNDQLPVFLTNMDKNFNELNEMGVKLTEKEKFDYLYNALPLDMVIKTNLISLQNEAWEKVSSYMIETNQRLANLKEERIKNGLKQITALNTESRKDQNMNESNLIRSSNNYDKFNKHRNTYKNKIKNYSNQSEKFISKKNTNYKKGPENNGKGRQRYKNYHK